MGMKLEKSWHERLKDEIAKPYIEKLKDFLDEEKQKGHKVYPPEPLVFNAFLHTPYEKVKVVIMGQDPYHGEGQAHGLSFSVPEGVLPPPSLKNIYKEIEDDLGIKARKSGCLIPWADQGVLLLNATLTVRAGEPKSHHGKGWEQFTDAVIHLLKEKQDPIVFLLWGKSAQEKCYKVEGTHHKVLKAGHPSPYSAHLFLGCKHFSQANNFLTSVGKSPIHWS